MIAKIGLFLGISMLSLCDSTAGEERRIVGYANGQPLYLAGAIPVRAAVTRVVSAPARVYRAAVPRVFVGSTGSYHGSPVFTGNAGYSGGDAYGYGYGYDYGYGNGNGIGYGNGFDGARPGCRNPYGWGSGFHRGNCAMNQPYPAAASRGYSWIPRYGATSSVSRYPH